MSVNLASHRSSVRQRLQDLRDVEGALRELDIDQPDVVERSMARYLTLRSVGYLEAVRDDLADLYAYSSGHNRLHRRIASSLRSGVGAAPEQLLTFVGSFDPAWRTILEAKLDADDHDLRNKLGAMVAARKKIAHGDGEQVTAGRALAWAEAAQAIGKCLLEIFDPGQEASV